MALELQILLAYIATHVVLMAALWAGIALAFKAGLGGLK